MKGSAGKRVLMLIENAPYSRDARVPREAETLVSAGYQVSVICPGEPSRPWRESVDGVCVFRYPAPGEACNTVGYLWEYTYSLVATLVLSLLVCWQRGFDIIHAANPPDTAVFVAAIYKLFGKRFVFDHHDLAPEQYDVRFGGRGHRSARQGLVWLERISCRLADHVIATNQSYKRIEMQRDQVPEARITVVRNGPALDRIRLVEPDPSLRQQGKVIIGYLGAMAFQDGVDYLVRALYRLTKDLERSDFYCVIIGKGSALADLKVLATELGLGERVWFTGFVPDADMLRYLSTADICVDPDPSNPFNDRCTMVKMMEYMALGKPIVAFDLPEHRVTADEAAVYARPNDELDFARQIAMLMDDPERRKRMGQVGRERVENELAWPHQEKYLLEAYEALSSSDKKPT